MSMSPRSAGRDPLRLGILLSGRGSNFQAIAASIREGQLKRAIPVLEGDDGDSLAERILVEEHIAYSEAIARVASGEFEIRDRRYVRL